MSNKWTWIIGVVGVAGVVLSIVFFVVTQNPTLRDVSAIGVGTLIGATITAIVAVGVFHGDERTRRIAEEKALVSRKLKLIAALPTRMEELNRLQAKVTSYNEAIARVDAAGRSQTEVAKTAIYQGLPEDAETARGEVEAFKHTAEGLSEQRAWATVELGRLKAMSDDEFLSEQKKLRDLL